MMFIVASGDAQIDEVRNLLPDNLKVVLSAGLQPDLHPGDDELLNSTNDV